MPTALGLKTEKVDIAAISRDVRTLANMSQLFQHGSFLRIRGLRVRSPAWW